MSAPNTPTVQIVISLNVGNDQGVNDIVDKLKKGLTLCWIPKGTSLPQKM